MTKFYSYINRISLKTIVLIALSAFVLTSCEKTDNLNLAIYNIMKNRYLWYDKVPSVNPEDYSKPDEFLDAIIYKPIDRWSFIMKTDDYEKEFVEGKFYGHGFSFGLDRAGKFRVAFVFKNSDLYTSGVRRGWEIKTINDVIPDTTNVWTLLGGNTAGLKNKFTFGKPVGTDTTLTFEKKELTMNMVLYRDTFHIADKIVGFIVFKGFIADALNELNEAFNYFKVNNVSELILDMRYNGGGDLDIANSLAGMLAGNIANNKTFVTLTYNTKNTVSNISYNIRASTYGLNISRLFTICSRSTASASEAIINGLRPYMDVMIIGDNTYGKPAGMNVMELSGYNYVLAPVTFKLTNSNGEGDYFKGLTADKSATDDLTHDFGDRCEECTAQALHFIEFGNFGLTQKSSFHPTFSHHWNGWQMQIGAY